MNAYMIFMLKYNVKSSSSFLSTNISIAANVVLIERPSNYIKMQHLNLVKWFLTVLGINATEHWSANKLVMYRRLLLSESYWKEFGKPVNDEKLMSSSWTMYILIAQLTRAQLAGGKLSPILVFFWPFEILKISNSWLRISYF